MPDNQGNPLPVQVLNAQPGAVPPSSLFGLPGITQWTEGKENMDGLVTTLAQGSQVSTIFPANFKQTDIVMGWGMEVAAAPTWTAGGGTLTASAQFPYNLVGPFGLNFQNQFDTINLPSGYHAAIMQAIRPQKWGYLPQFADQQFSSNAYSSQTNQSTATNYTTGSTSVKFTLDLMPSILFDQYYDLEEDGRLYEHKMSPIRAYVTPQLMSGTNRVVTPRLTWNQLLGTAGDSTPVTSVGGAPTASGTATLGFRRYAVYQPGGINDTPPVFNWQYSRDNRRFTLSGVSSIDIAIPQVGQILSMAFAMWDPTLNSGAGGPLPITSVKECDVLYGSGLFKNQDTPQRMQNRLQRQHGLILPEGVLAWDWALMDNGTITNAKALNTLTTSGCTLHIDFTGSQSATAYGYLLIEALRYVSIG